MSTTFQLETPASASALMSAFQSIWDTGSTVLAALDNSRAISLVDFEQKVEALNARRQRANRISPPYTAVTFVASDLLDMDQTQTSATVRADTQAVTLQERSVSTNAVVQSKTFSTSDGTAEAIATGNTLYRVLTTDGGVPVGTFSLQLFQKLQMSVLTFDLAAMPPTPQIVVSASPDGVVFTTATQVSMNGYRLTAWFPPMEMRYVTLAITPAAPDTLGGSSYTFGLTDFVGAETEFQLSSALVTVPLIFVPTGTALKLLAPADVNLLYFFSFDGGTWQEYNNNDTVAIPGTTSAVISTVAMDTTGLLSIALPANTYPGSIRVVDESTGASVNLAPGLLPTDANISALVKDYVAVVPGSAPSLHYISAHLSAAAGKTFKVSYAAGPSSLTVQLKVQLVTSDRTQTPTFTGASLQEL